MGILGGPGLGKPFPIVAQIFVFFVFFVFFQWFFGYFVDYSMVLSILLVLPMCFWLFSKVVLVSCLECCLTPLLPGAVEGRGGSTEQQRATQDSREQQRAVETNRDKRYRGRESTTKGDNRQRQEGAKGRQRETRGRQRELVTISYY